MRGRFACAESSGASGRPCSRTTGRTAPLRCSLRVEPPAAEHFRKNCPFQGPRRHFLRQNETLRTPLEPSQRARSTWTATCNSKTKRNDKTQGRPGQPRQRRSGSGAGGRGAERRPRVGDCGGWQEVGGTIAGDGGGVRRWRQKLRWRRRWQRRRRRRRRRGDGGSGGHRSAADVTCGGSHTVRFL